MKRISWGLIVLLAAPMAWAASLQVIEVKVEGMACPFCARGIETNLGKLPGVAKAQVNLESGSARVIAKPGEKVDAGRVKQAILDAGFTPGEIKVKTEEK